MGVHRLRSRVHPVEGERQEAHYSLCFFPLSLPTRLKLTLRAPCLLAGRPVFFEVGVWSCWASPSAKRVATLLTSSPSALAQSLPSRVRASDPEALSQLMQ